MAGAVAINPHETAIPSRRSRGLDPFFLTVVVLILTIGIVMVTSASYIIASGKFGDGFYYAKKQGLAMVVGLAVMCLFSMVNSDFWKRAALPMMAVGLILLALVFVPGIGVEMGGAHRWVRMPLGFFVQPSEFIKYAFVMFMAGSLAKKGESVRDFAIGFLPHVLVMGIVVFFHPVAAGLRRGSDPDVSGLPDAVRGRRACTAFAGRSDTLLAVPVPDCYKRSVSPDETQGVSRSLG